MWHHLKFWLDSRPLCVVTRPLAGLVVAGTIAGVFGSLCGLAYGAFHDSLYFAIVDGLRLAGAGAAAGFIGGLWSGLDRLNWPVDEWDGSEKPSRLLPLVKVHFEPRELPSAPRRSTRRTARSSAV
jgi:hypothetical protein